MATTKPADNDHKCYQEFREKELFIDCILETDDGSRFPVHQVVLVQRSEYFYQRLVDPDRITEKGVCQVRVEGIPSAILKIILDLMYFQSVVLNCSAAKEMLPWADRLEMPELVKLCCDRLVKLLDRNNCIGIYEAIKTNEECQSYARTIKRFLLKNFSQVYRESREFLELAHEDLFDILKMDELGVKDETETFEAVEKWINHEPIARNKHFYELFQAVRVGLLESPDLLARIGESPLMEDECRRILTALSNEPGTSNPHLCRFLAPRCPYEILLVIGGWTSGNPSNFVEIFDVKAHRWSVGGFADVHARAYHGVQFLDGLVYVIGGFDGSLYYSTVRCFDSETKVWMEKANMYNRRCYVSTCVLDDCIYALGGYNGHNRMDSVERYDATKNQWNLIAPMRRQRSDASASSFKGKVYIVGGFTGQDVLDSVEYYEPVKNTWTLMTSLMSSPRSGVSLIASEFGLFVIGGFNGTQRLNTAERYDHFYDRWVSIANMITQRSNFTTVVLEGRIYAIGGFDGVTTISSVECYSHESDTWSSAPPMNVNRSASSACVLRDLKNPKDFAWGRATLSRLSMVPHTYA